MVSTVVVMSGTDSRLMVELRTPMPNASTAMIVNRGQPEDTPVAVAAMTAATPVARASVVIATASRLRREESRLPIRPAAAAPTRNEPSEVRHAGAENPDAPAAAKPSRTTLPVMFAVKTWPKPR